MNAGKVMAEIRKLMEALEKREDALRPCKRLRLPQGAEQEAELERFRQLAVNASTEVSSSLAAIRIAAGDDRFAAFSDDELLVAALKFASLYYDDGVVDFASNDLAKIIGVEHPERLAALVDAVLVKKKSPLNDCLGISHRGVDNGGYEFSPFPDELNALFIAGRS